MTLESRHLFGAVLVATAAHLAAVGWLWRYTPVTPVGGGYSVMRVRLGETRALPAAQAAPAPVVAPRPPEPRLPEPPKVEVAKPEPPKPKPQVRKVADVPKPTPPERRFPPTPVVAREATTADAAAPAAPPAVSTGALDGASTGAPVAGGASGDAADAAPLPGDPELPPAYVGQVRSWLERHRTYPLAARRQRIEGRALLWFRIDRRGRVLAYRIEESSGHGMLDRAVEQMIERASPLPRVPSQYPVDEPEFLIPIDFRLR